MHVDCVISISGIVEPSFFLGPGVSEVREREVGKESLVETRDMRYRKGKMAAFLPPFLCRVLSESLGSSGLQFP